MATSLEALSSEAAADLLYGGPVYVFGPRREVAYVDNHKVKARPQIESSTATLDMSTTVRPR